MRRFRLGVASAIGVLGLAIPAWAQPTEQQIVQALLLRPTAPDKITGSRSADAIFGDRGLSIPGGGRKAVPSIDIKVNFEFDSDQLRDDAVSALDTLGRALSNDKLKGQTIEIVGHTDARGADAYNDDLSERRAEAVVRYVTEKFGLDPKLISARGMGKRKLLDVADPEGEANRRVEIRNITPSG